MIEFFQMGGHGAYIWLSYGIAALALGGLFFKSRRDAKLLRAQVTSLRPRRPQAGQSE